MTELASKFGLRVALVVFSLVLASIIYAADAGIAAPVFAYVRSFPLGDKIAHFILMGTLALLVNLVLSRGLLAGNRHPILIGTAIVAGLVLLEEISQIWIPGRTFSFSDLTADALGIACGALIARVPRRSRVRHSQES